jgi:amino acid transporter
VRSIGTLAFSAAIVNVVVGSAIFQLPAAVALEAGRLAPAAYLICAVVMAGVVVCFAEAGSRVPTSGGAYGTVGAAFGPASGYVVGALLIVTSVLASGGIAAALADIAGTVVPGLGAGAPRIAVILAIYAVMTWANLVGVRTTARVITAATAVKIIPLILFVGLGAVTWHHVPHAIAQAPKVSVTGFGRALILTLFAFEGMETALMNSGEVRDPNRTVPRALFIAMLFTLVLYLGVQLSAQHLLGPGLPHAAAPLAEAAGQISDWARFVMLAAAAMSMLAWMASDVMGNSRMLFAFSRDRQLPSWFGNLHSRIHVPANAVVTYVVVGAVLALTGSFVELVVLSSLGTVVIYAMTCAAALRLHHRGVALAGAPLGFRALPAAAAVGIVGMAGMVYAAQWSEIAGTAAVIVASLGLYEVMRRLRTE